MTASHRFCRITCAALLFAALAACSGKGGTGSSGGTGSTGQGSTGESTAAHGSGSSGGSSGSSTTGASNCGTATLDFGNGSESGDFVSARFDTSGEIGAGIGLPDGGVAVLLGTNATSACAALHLQTPAGETTATALLLTLDATATAAGVYAIQPDGGGPVGARYISTLTDGQGNGTGGTAPSRAGSITIAAFDGGSIAGSFDLTFDSSHVTGEFESSGCGVCLQ